MKSAKLRQDAYECIYGWGQEKLMIKSTRMDEGCEGEKFLIQALRPVWKTVLIDK